VPLDRRLSIVVGDDHDLGEDPPNRATARNEGEQCQHDPEPRHSEEREPPASTDTHCHGRNIVIIQFSLLSVPVSLASKDHIEICLDVTCLEEVIDQEFVHRGGE